MNYISKYAFLLLIVVISKTAYTQEIKEPISFKSEDGVSVTADIYMTENNDAPFIILFHQATFSRGEYIEIAPMLNNLGFNCMAIDQRSGLQVNGITNQTHKDAKRKGKETKYKDAYPDLEASLKYVKEKYSPNDIIVWGSSYSSSLVFVLAAKHKEIKGVLAFSPGEYFKFENKTIAEWAKEVHCPIFITSSRKEGKECSVIFENISNKNSTQYIPAFSGNHGSKALWKKNTGHDSYQEKVNTFLISLSKTDNE